MKLEKRDQEENERKKRPSRDLSAETKAEEPLSEDFLLCDERTRRGGVNTGAHGLDRKVEKEKE